MKILINASNLNGGGGLQVADSICRQLNRFSSYEFIVVLSPYLDKTAEVISNYKNVMVYNYLMPHSIGLLITGRNDVLDDIVKKEKVDRVLTIFGPSFWVPRVPHLCGFASGQLTPQDSPFYKTKLPIGFRVRDIIRNWVMKTYYGRCSDYLYSENESVSSELRKIYPKKKVFTVTNYYNQVFDHPEQWKEHRLPEFNGKTFLTVTDTNRHKNVEIAIDIAKILKERHPEFDFRFVFTFNESQYPAIEPSLKKHFLFIGRVDVSECPSLYEQCDLEFQPTLLECFTATYPEAMRMSRPIVTTNLAFARQLCGDAAAYYSPLDASDAAEVIYKVAIDEQFSKMLVENGTRQLSNYDNYEERANKLVNIITTL